MRYQKFRPVDILFQILYIEVKVDKQLQFELRSFIEIHGTIELCVMLL